MEISPDPLPGNFKIALPSFLRIVDTDEFGLDVASRR